MQFSATFGLKEPEDTDKVNQQDFNYNSEIIDKQLKIAKQTLGIVDILLQGVGLIDYDENQIIDYDNNNIIS